MEALHYRNGARRVDEIKAANLNPDPKSNPINVIVAPVIKDARRQAIEPHTSNYIHQQRPSSSSSSSKEKERNEMPEMKVLWRCSLSNKPEGTR